MQPGDRLLQGGVRPVEDLADGATRRCWIHQSMIHDASPHLGSRRPSPTPDSRRQPSCTGDDVVRPSRQGAGPRRHVAGCLRPTGPGVTARSHHGPRSGTSPPASLLQRRAAERSCSSPSGCEGVKRGDITTSIRIWQSPRVRAALLDGRRLGRRHVHPRDRLERHLRVARAGIGLSQPRDLLQTARHGAGHKGLTSSASTMSPQALRSDAKPVSRLTSLHSAAIPCRSCRV